MIDEREGGGKKEKKSEERRKSRGGDERERRELKGKNRWDINQILTILNFGVSMWNTEHMNRDLSASFNITDAEKQD